MSDISKMTINDSTYNLKDAEARSKINDIILVQDTEPQTDNNKLWITDDAATEFTIPTMTDFDELADRVNTRALTAKVFRKVGCIGDGYTTGHIYLSEDMQPDVWEQSWPKHMEKLTGNKWINFGISGTSCKTWIDDGILDFVLNSCDRCDAYVIGLMINDSDPNSYAYVPLGTPSDIGTENNTYYAYYFRLIDTIHTQYPQAAIFCNTCPRTEARFADYNTAVRTIVEYCQTSFYEGREDNGEHRIFLCDLASERYNNEEYYKHPIFSSDYYDGYFSGFSYYYMAECYLRVMSDALNESDYLLHLVTNQVLNSNPSDRSYIYSTTPTINGVDGIRYICTQPVTEITIFPAQTGIIDVVFISGSTPAILSVPSFLGVIFPDWFDASSALEANTIYEINIMDGKYAVVATWPYAA